MPRSIYDTARDLGYTLRPVNERSRNWLTLQRGLARLAGNDDAELTDAQRRQVAAEYRRMKDERGRSKLPEWKLLRKFNKQQVSRAKKRGASNPIIRRLDKLPRSAGEVVFVPNDPRGALKRFVHYDEFVKFITLPHYARDRKALLGAGRFVVGRINSDTNDLYRKKNGKPKYTTVLVEGDIDGNQKTGKATRRRKHGVPRK